MTMTRVMKKDPDAVWFLGDQYYHGKLGLQEDMQKAVELWTEAAELGSIDALYNLGVLYDCGEGVEKDQAKAVQFFKKGSIQGHSESRCNFACCEEENGNFDSAVKHLLIAAKMGRKESVESIKRMFMEGGATKEQYAEAPKGYQETPRRE